ncbi:hypothetical protein NLU13_2465 [Sarocladium strictum]|uniref:Uncharacterized protein n=1 Tax=Sarocladium strictum TaxID=5046 RepID=A0AA39GBM2_SARSR|nr:hypothetical protein NLU13_8410 [Sarocladium strictum]KAK0388888.1 hypothetical protein NLU13_2465 [Sarocladium strictum]
MFGTFTTLQNLPRRRLDPNDIPPPTPVTLPRYQPLAHDDLPGDGDTSLPSLLQNIGRSAVGIGPVGFSAIGLDLKLDAPLDQMIPDPDFIPDFRKWDALSQDSARDQNQTTRAPLRNGNSSPGCQVYLERKKELANANEDAFRTVRRISPPKGKQQARLGNAYEFFRCLELFTTFWDDPTQPPEMPPSPELSSTELSERQGENTQPSPEGQAPSNDDGKQMVVQRTAPGTSMPPEYRQSLLSAFIKLVAYDFGCNVAAARVEPRLQLVSSKDPKRARKTSCPSGCSFVYQSATTREAARAGIIHGPVAAVSSRGGVDFATPDVETAQSLDLAREIIAALITAQHRAREGKTEKRFGEGEWWTSKPRWGGGSGGPIGREIEKDSVQGDKDAPPTDENGLPAPIIKKARKTMSIYDNYRMVRPPASTWDKKARYEAIGRQRGADYDDIFVFSSLFHHVSIMRVRVPQRLLDVLDGDAEPDLRKRSWGKVPAWRSQWFDLFSVEDRTEAMRMLWAVMAWQMRKTHDDQDTPMAGA